MSKRLLSIFILGFAVLFLAEVVAVHSFFATKVLAAADFHSRWYGGKVLLVEGRDPYSPEVTAEIEAIRDPEGNRNNSFSFAFPLHVIFTFWPLSYFSYDWAQSFWMVTLQWAIFAITLLMMRMVGWKPSPLGIGGALLGSIFFYPAARTILLGQFTLHVTLFMALSIYFLRQRRDGWAGIWLAATSIKPQMVLMVGVWMVLWALFKRRTRFLWGLIGGGLALLAGSMILLPRWPISFFEDIQRYAAVASGRNPMDVLGEFILPGSPTLIGTVVTVVLLLSTLVAWYWGVGGKISPVRIDPRDEDLANIRFEWVLFWTIAVSLLVLFQTGSTNQMLLFIPLFLWFWEGLKSWGRLPSVIVAVVLIIGPWILFLTTKSGNYEHPLLLLPLPVFCLIVLGLKAFKMRDDGRLGKGLETAE